MFAALVPALEAIKDGEMHSICEPHTRSEAATFQPEGSSLQTCALSGCTAGRLEVIFLLETLQNIWAWQLVIEITQVLQL